MLKGTLNSVYNIYPLHEKGNVKKKKKKKKENKMGAAGKKVKCLNMKTKDKAR